MHATNRGRYVGGGKNAACAGKQARQDSGEGGRRASLQSVDMGILIKHHRVTGLGVDTDANLVGHGPGGHVDGVFLAKELGDLGFERLHCWVIAVDVVADIGIRHGLAHRRCWRLQVSLRRSIIGVPRVRAQGKLSRPRKV